MLSDHFALGFVSVFFFVILIFALTIFLIIKSRVSPKIEIPTPTPTSANNGYQGQPTTRPTVERSKGKKKRLPVILPIFALFFTGFASFMWFQISVIEGFAAPLFFEIILGFFVLVGILMFVHWFMVYYIFTEDGVTWARWGRKTYRRFDQILAYQLTHRRDTKSHSGRFARYWQLEVWFTPDEKRPQKAVKLTESLRQMGMSPILNRIAFVQEYGRFPAPKELEQFVDNKDTFGMLYTGEVIELKRFLGRAQRRPAPSGQTQQYLVPWAKTQFNFQPREQIDALQPFMDSPDITGIYRVVEADTSSLQVQRQTTQFICQANDWSNHQQLLKTYQKLGYQVEYRQNFAMPILPADSTTHAGSLSGSVLIIYI